VTALDVPNVVREATWMGLAFGIGTAVSKGVYGDPLVESIAWGLVATTVYVVVDAVHRRRASEGSA
jgi:hypothetical protein